MESSDDRSYLQVHLWRSTSRKMTKICLLLFTLLTLSGAVCRVRHSIWKYSWTPTCNIQFQNTPGPPRATCNLKILLEPRLRHSIWKYSWTPACDIQFGNTSGPPCATCNLKILLDPLRATFNLEILLDTRVRHSIWKYSWTPACNPHFPKGVSCLSLVFPILVPHIPRVNNVKSC